MQNGNSIDKAALRELAALQEEGDTSLVVDLIDVFIKASTERLRDIRSAIEKGDLWETAKAAHNFKSGSRTLGALALGQLCEQLELRTKTVEEARKIEEQIKAECGRACAELTSMRQKFLAKENPLAD